MELKSTEKKNGEMFNKNLGKNFGNALREIRNAAQISQEKLALDCGLDRTYISMLERGLKIPTLKTIDQLSASLNIAPEMLATLAFRPNQSSHGPTSIKLPFLGNSLSCGLPIGSDSEVDKIVSIEGLIPTNQSTTFYAKAAGESMAPTIQDGDILVIDGQKKPKNGSIVLAQIMNEFSIKRFFKNGQSFRLVPDNPTFKTIAPTREVEIQICGVVQSLIRNSP